MIIVIVNESDCQLKQSTMSCWPLPLIIATPSTPQFAARCPTTDVADLGSSDVTKSRPMSFAVDPEIIGVGVAVPYDAALLEQ